MTPDRALRFASTVLESSDDNQFAIDLMDLPPSPELIVDALQKLGCKVEIDKVNPSILHVTVGKKRVQTD